MISFANAGGSTIRSRSWSSAAALICTLAFVSACESATAPLPSEGRPASLVFSIGGFGGMTRDLELRGDTLVARRTSWTPTPGIPTDSVRVVPSAEEWRAFWAAANGAGVQRWAGMYVAEGVMDGTGWGLRMLVDGRQFDVSGSNAYPDRSGRKHDLERTAEFKSFTAALNVLVGRPGWF